MKIASYSIGEGAPRPGLISHGLCIDMATVAAAFRALHEGKSLDLFPNDQAATPDVRSLIESVENNLQALRRLDEFAHKHLSGEFVLPLDRVRLHAPITNPYMLGEMETNCVAQFEQQGVRRRAYPAMAVLPDTVINDPGMPVVLPPWSGRVSVSAQIAFVCGRNVEGATETDAEHAIFGYTLSLAFTSSGFVDMLRNPHERDISVNEAYGHWLDGFRPYGPWIVTRDEFDLLTPRSLNLSAGSHQVVTSTTAMLHSPARILAVLSEHIPFYPGDVVGLGAMDHDIELPFDLPLDGLKVVAEVEGIGRLETTVTRLNPSRA